MPCSLAVDPQGGAVFVASMKLGMVYRGRGRAGDAEDVALQKFSGPFQEAYGLHHDGDALFVLYRRSLSRLVDADGDGRAERTDRIATWPQGLVSSYDWAYGLPRRPDGSFYFGLAPWANRRQLGSGNVLRLRPDGTLEEIAYGLRNPVGWCTDLEGELFVTNNQGEWVATNRLCHIRPGRFYGFPNPEQPEHHDRPRGVTSVWVPYTWAHSINGVAVDSTAGRFGPFAGQFFLAELEAGGALVRAALEEVDGVRQGACFRFWGEGLLGPLALAFDPAGALWVGSITGPAWMGQPDRGARFVDDVDGEVEACTQGQTPDEMYFGTGDTVPDELATSREAARADRLATNRAVACEAGHR